MYAIANRTEAIIRSQQNSKQKIIIEFDNIDSKDDHSIGSLSAITCTIADHSTRSDKSIKQPQKSTTNLPCFYRTKRPKRGRSCLSEYDKSSCTSSFFHSEKSMERIEKLYTTTGRALSSGIWLEDFETKCHSKQIEYNNSTKIKRRKSLLKSLKEVNKIKRSQSERKGRKKNGPRRRESTSVSSVTHRNTVREHLAKEASDQKKIAWYNVELDIMRDGVISIINGWLNPVFEAISDDASSVIDEKKVEDFIKQFVGDDIDEPKKSTIKKFVGKKMDKDTARMYESIDNGAFSLWNTKFMKKKFYEHKEKPFVPIKRMYHTETINVPRWFNT